MIVTGDHGGRLRTFGAVWLLLVPVLYLMGATSTLQSEAEYLVQLAVFSVLAVAGAILGVAGLLRRMWAAVGLLILSSLCAAYCFGQALLMLVAPRVPSVAAESSFPALLGTLMGVAVGLPFLYMARALWLIVRAHRTGRTGEA
jgi:hypothetical protein